MEQVNPDEFDALIINDNRRTLVLFYASWCPYCTKFRPFFDSIGVSNIRKIEALVDEDENPLWDRFNIQSIPTIIGFEKGKIIARRDAKKQIGLTRDDMKSIVDELT